MGYMRAERGKGSINGAKISEDTMEGKEVIGIKQAGNGNYI